MQTTEWTLLSLLLYLATVSFLLCKGFQINMQLDLLKENWNKVVII